MATLETGSGHVRCLSVGRTCQTAAQIRRYCRDEQAGFFDWLVTPHDALIDIVANDMTMDLSPEMVEYRIANDGPRIQHKQLNISFFHDYGLETPESYMNDIQRVSDKYRFLGERWNDALQSPEPTLLVRFGSSLAEAEELSTIFDEKFCNAQVGVLAVHPLQDHEPDALREPEFGENVVLVGVRPSVGEHAWEGNSDEWDRAFRIAETHLLNSG